MMAEKSPIQVKKRHWMFGLFRAIHAYLVGLPPNIVLGITLVFLPIALASADIGLKWLALGKGAPRDSIADLQLAALSINALHFIRETFILKVIGALVVLAAITLFAQLVLWFITLFVVRRFEVSSPPTSRLFFSYVGGVVLFIFATTWMQLVLLPIEQMQ